MSQTREGRISNLHVSRQVYRVTFPLREGLSLQLPYMRRPIPSGDHNRLQDTMDEKTSIREVYQRIATKFLNLNPIYLLKNFDIENTFSVPDDTLDYNNFSTQSSEE